MAINLEVIQDQTTVEVATAGLQGAPGIVTRDLPIGRYVQLTRDINGSVGITKGTEFCWPFNIPGTGIIDRVAFLFSALSTDANNIIRFGVRADATGVAGAILYETSIPANAAGGGSTGWKEMTVSLPSGQNYWISFCAQGTGASVPTIEQGNADSQFLNSGLGASLTTMGWAAGHGPITSVATNASSTLAAGPIPTGPGTNQLGNAVPCFVVRRGS